MRKVRRDEIVACHDEVVLISSRYISQLKYPEKLTKEEKDKIFRQVKCLQELVEKRKLACAIKNEAWLVELKEQYDTEVEVLHNLMNKYV